MKRLLPVVAVALILVLSIVGCTRSASQQPSPTTVQTAFSPGDANQDGIVNMGDVTKVERIMLGIDPLTPGADVNGDGVVNMGDVIRIERIILGLN